MSGQLPWYVSRSAGLVAWALLTASVLWGLALSTKVLGRRPRPAWLLDMHRYLGGLATIFTGVHIVAAIADTYVHFDLASVLIPFRSTWKPGAIAWGVVALYLLLAVELTSLARRHVPRRLWRAVHVASFPLFLLATIHALTAGTDAHAWIFEVVAVLAIAGVAGLTGMRVATETVRPAHPARTGRPAPAVPSAAKASAKAPATPASPVSDLYAGSQGLHSQEPQTAGTTR